MLDKNRLAWVTHVLNTIMLAENRAVAQYFVQIPFLEFFLVPAKHYVL